MLPQHKDGKFTFDVEVRSTEIEIFRIDFNQPEGVGNETFYAEQGFKFVGEFARGDTSGDGDTDRELILPNQSASGAIATLTAQNGEPFDLLQFDVDFENIESSQGEFLRIRGFDDEGNEVAEVTRTSEGVVQLPESFRGVSRVEFELVDPNPSFNSDRMHIDNVIVAQTPGDGPNAAAHAVEHGQFMLTVKAVADKPMVGEPVTVKFGDVNLGNPGIYKESGMVFQKILPFPSFEIEEDNDFGHPPEDAELEIHGLHGRLQDLPGGRRALLVPQLRARAEQPRPRGRTLRLLARQGSVHRPG